MSEPEVVPCVWKPCFCDSFDACTNCGGAGGKYVRVKESTGDERRACLDRHPRREEFIEKGKGGSFYTVSPLDMTKDDLYMMIGYLGEERAQREKSTEEFHRMIDAIDLAR